MLNTQGSRNPLNFLNSIKIIEIIFVQTIYILKKRRERTKRK